MKKTAFWYGLARHARGVTAQRFVQEVDLTAHTVRHAHLPLAHVGA